MDSIKDAAFEWNAVLRYPQKAKTVFLLIWLTIGDTWPILSSNMVAYRYNAISSFPIMHNTPPDCSAREKGVRTLLKSYHAALLLTMELERKTHGNCCRFHARMQHDRCFTVSNTSVCRSHKIISSTNHTSIEDTLSKRIRCQNEDLLLQYFHHPFGQHCKRPRFW